MKRQPTPARKPAAPILRIEWRRLGADEDRFCLVAIRADGTEVKVTTPDGHVVTTGG